MAKTKKDTPIPPSLQPRKSKKKPIPNAVTSPQKETASFPKKEVAKKKSSTENKKRFTLWISDDIHRAFKIHVATIGGSHSEYIEELIKKDLNLD